MTAVAFWLVLALHGLVVWVGAGLIVAILFGGAIRIRDRQIPHD